MPAMPMSVDEVLDIVFRADKRKTRDIAVEPGSEEEAGDELSLRRAFYELRRAGFDEVQIVAIRGMFQIAAETAVGKCLSREWHKNNKIDSTVLDRPSPLPAGLNAFFNDSYFLGYYVRDGAHPARLGISPGSDYVPFIRAEILPVFRYAWQRTDAKVAAHLAAKASGGGDGPEAAV